MDCAAGSVPGARPTPARAWAMILLALSAPLAACVAPTPPTGTLAATFEHDAWLVDGIVLIRSGVLEGYFVGPSVESTPAANASLVVRMEDLDASRPSVDQSTPPVELLLPPPKGFELRVRLKDPSLFNGYTIGWGRRASLHLAGEPDEHTPGAEEEANREICRQLNLNARRDRPPEQEQSFNVTSVGLYIIMAEVLRDGKRAGMVCQPFVATVGATWRINGTIQPIAASATAFFAGASTPGGEKMADEYSVDIEDVDRAPRDRRFPEAKLTASTRFRGTWDASKGSWIDARILANGAPVFAFPGTCKISWSDPQRPGGIEDLATNDLEARITKAGKWSVRVGAATAQWWEFLCPHVYPNQGPVPYTLDVRLTYR